MPGSLNSDQLHSYREDGFVKPIRAFSPERAVELRENIERIERECADADKPIDINQYFRVNGQVVIPLLYEMTRTEAVLDAVESVLGPNLLVWSCELFIKEAGSEKIVSWHQDMTYWGMGGSDKQATAWIAITNVSEEAGCMRFVPGSHKQQLVPHMTSFPRTTCFREGRKSRSTSTRTTRCSTISLRARCPCTTAEFFMRPDPTGLPTGGSESPSDTLRRTWNARRAAATLRPLCAESTSAGTG